MIRILAATTNPGKVREIKDALEGLSFEVRTLADYPDLSVFPEAGRTFEENARGKCLFYSRAAEGLVLAEDSGLEIAALNGAPGVYSARFSGEDATDDKNIDTVLGLLAEVPPAERGARFVCCVALSHRERIVAEIRGMVEGTIAAERRGRAGFGYDPIFYYPPAAKTFGQLTPEEKNAVSHRGRALRELKSFLERYLSEQADKTRG
jgi:XTP/dITP diphosphohydrolase